MSDVSHPILRPERIIICDYVAFKRDFHKGLTIKVTCCLQDVMCDRVGGCQEGWQSYLCAAKPHDQPHADYAAMYCDNMPTENRIPLTNRHSCPDLSASAIRPESIQGKKSMPACNSPVYAGKNREMRTKMGVLFTGISRLRGEKKRKYI